MEFEGQDADRYPVEERFANKAADRGDFWVPLNPEVFRWSDAEIAESNDGNGFERYRRSQR